MFASKNNWMIILSLAVVSCSKKAEKSPVTWPEAQAPVADIKPHNRIIHGDTVVDNYYWLNDFFKKGPDSVNVVKYLEAENAYTKEMMAGTEDLQQQLFEEMK